MNRLVDDLLWLSRVEQNERVRPTGTVDTAALVRETAQTLKPLADGVDVAVEVIVDDAAPAVSGIATNWRRSSRTWWRTP